MTLRHQHGLAPAGGTAREVRAIRCLRVVLRDDLPGNGRHSSDGLIGKVERCLLFSHEARVETILPGVPGDL